MTFLGDIEEHEAVCPHRTVNCPAWNCNAIAPLDKLVDHFITSNCCANTSGPSEALPCWNRLNYSTVLREDRLPTSWAVNMVEHFNEVLVVFPLRSEGQYYFVPIMLASEDVCSRFKVEMIVHQREAEVSDSKISVKFQGNPLSIDYKKSDFKLFGTSEQLMKKIQRQVGDFSVFSLSFKVSIEN